MIEDKDLDIFVGVSFIANGKKDGFAIDVYNEESYSPIAWLVVLQSLVDRFAKYINEHNVDIIEDFSFYFERHLPCIEFEKDKI